MEDLEFHAAGMARVAGDLRGIGQRRYRISLTSGAGNGLSLGEAIDTCAAVWNGGLAGSEAAAQQIAGDVAAALAAMQATEQGNEDRARAMGGR